ncbi:hypothetical protein UFOVP225_18 [uncultured Caudovirales phage]|uniref:Uncharacterized protein n=1 Tax=uncultured Caudovirales phage TaxID=2100421 RepID=A0A6J7WSG2_9CAUD|nr:hypothetical protein UFOVP113_31 [uncultured Caudovirales phage]CAB5219044.1 hypothetical protein UFOVP225_18 [uncultured Caudovirales phage]
MANTDKALRQVKKDSATAARVLRTQVPQQPGYNGVVTKKEAGKKVTSNAIRAVSRTDARLEDNSAKGFDQSPRDRQVYKAIGAGRTAQFKSDLERSRAGRLERGIDMPRKGIVGVPKGTI